MLFAYSIVWQLPCGVWQHVESIALLDICLVWRGAQCVIVHDTCVAIVNVFKSQYIQFPTGANLQQVINGFESKCQMIQCAGAIDGYHIPVKPPAQNHTDFYNRKG